jgi:hypothetical protein
MNSTGHDQETFLHVDHIADAGCETDPEMQAIDALIHDRFGSELDTDGYLVASYNEV